MSNSICQMRRIEHVTRLMKFKNAMIVETNIKDVIFSLKRV